MQVCRIGSSIGRRDSHQDVFRTSLGVFHKDVEVSVVLEDTRVEKFILHLVAVAASVGLQQIGVGIGRLRIFVQKLHVRVRRRAVEVEVILFDVLAVVAFAVGQSKQPLFENRIPAVPEGQGKAKLLLVVGNACQTILAPAIRPRTGMIVGEKIPGITILAIVLANRPPLAFAEVRAPFFPGGVLFFGLLKSLVFDRHVAFHKLLIE